MSDMRVLLVEDNIDDEVLAIRSLRKAHLANPVDVARDGQEALDFLFGTETRPAGPAPSLILLDLKLPRVDGLEVLARIRRDERTRRTPVVILTSSSEERDLMSGYDRGANSYVQKPVSFDEFSEAVAKVGIYWLMVNKNPPPAGDQPGLSAVSGSSEAARE